MNKKDIPIFDQRLCSLLMLLKHRLVSCRPDKEVKTKLVYFVDTNNDNFDEDFEFFKKYKDEVYELVQNFKREKLNK